MRIQIIAVGKLKEQYLKMGVEEYLQRLSPYAKTEVLEVQEEKGQEPLHEAEIRQILSKEGNRIMRILGPETHTIALDIKGVALSSETLAHQIHQLATYGRSRLAFVIGGSYGLSKEVLQRADYNLSFSKMTFPHPLMRLILLEQLYRSFKINRGETYHK